MCRAHTSQNWTSKRMVSIIMRCIRSESKARPTAGCDKLDLQSLVWLHEHLALALLMGKAFSEWERLNEIENNNKLTNKRKQNEQQTHEGHGGTSLVCGQIILGMDVLRRKLAPILAGELKDWKTTTTISQN